ncbi:DUF4279 domain-containing protein [Candidatus Peregrinibacteria bacterium]|nr:DUF4279 domain-containing protein [Candidatus Peregrinibacteria bacterium]
MKKIILEKAIEEIKERCFGTTQQYLSVLKIKYENDQPVISKLEIREKEAIVYFEIEKERFFFTVYLDTQPEISVRWIDITPGIRIYLRAISYDRNTDDLISCTKIKPSEVVNMGDQLRYGKGMTSKFHAITIEPDKELAGSFEEKLKNFVNILEKDAKGIIKLTKISEVCIQVVPYYYIGNGCIGGFYFEPQIIKRLGKLNLKIDFDMYVWGEPFR